MKTPLRYAGGKSKAYKIITEYLPEHLPTGRIVSPFLGGGSLESRWSSELGIPVKGYDVLHPLVIFWNILLDHREDLVARCRYLEPTKEEYKAVKDELLKWCITQMMFPHPMSEDEKDRWAYYRVPDEEMTTLCHKDAAAYFFYNHNLSYGPMYLGWMSKLYESREKWDRMIDRLEKYVNPNLDVKIGNMIDTIPYHNKDFLYLDPPYYLEKDADNKMFKGMYPNANFPIYHNNFDHEYMAMMLSRHEGPFVLSYNNCETIREWYSEYELVYPEWHYSYSLGETRVGKNKENNDPKKSHEILIIKR